MKPGILHLTTLVFLFVSSSLFGQVSHIYVSDAGNWSNPPWKIMKYDMNGGNAEIFIDEQMAWPQDILFLDDQGVVLISNLNSGRINKHDPVTGAYIGLFAQGISGPTRMAIGPDNLIYVLQWNGEGKVRRYTQDGNFVDLFTSSGVPQSIGLAWDDADNLYVSSYKEDIVRKFDPGGQDMGLFVKDNLVGPTNIWFDENGELLVSDYDGTAVKRFDAEGNYVSDYLTGLSQSEGVAYLPNGNILMGNGKTHSVKQFDPAGNYINDLVPDGAGGLKTPNAVVIHSGTSAVENMSIANSFSINPTAGISFLIDDLGASEDTVHCEIFNMAGVKVDEFRFKDQIQWDGSKFPKGTYQIRIYQQDRYCIKQIVISY